MSGGYDLYGTYYPNINDAINAEMSQCNEIDNRFNQKKIKELESKISRQQQEPSDPEEQFHYLWEKIKELEKRIETLETNGNE